MNAIRFQNVMPQVFAAAPPADSEIWGCDICFERGRTYLVEAASGKGKSTFCSYVMGYRRDYSGTVFFDDTDIRRLNVGDWTDVRMRHVSLLFQELRLFPELTALENVEIKNKLTDFKTAEQIARWFELLGIADKKNVKAGRMSFGQQQRVAMIRALVQPFDFLVADEPISHLDDDNSRLLAQLMMEEARAQGAAVVVTSIGKHMALNYDHVVRL